MKYSLILPLLLLWMTGVLCADTVLLKDGQEVKGVVVEDYHDRVIFSTERGELCFLKGSIEKIGYDSPEENFVKLGALYKDKGDYRLAMHCYQAAYRLNPNLKEAQAGTALVSNMLLRKRESDLEKEVALRQESSQAEAGELWNKAGISIENAGPDIKVGRVLKGSPAEGAGIKEGDIIVSIWGKLLRYMPLKDVYGLFLQNSASEQSEQRIVVSRNGRIPLKKGRLFGGAEYLLGGRLKTQLEGLVVSEVRPGGPLEDADIAEGDRITQLAGASTRYLPLEAAYKLIEGREGGLLEAEIQRELIFWSR